ncbi:MAG: type II secretion system protein [Rhodopirellula sp. JB044]|uniref:type II secretion system protein n=1 Tax=Rhodopirellula sp. JB044 TaxID=3342844 RepID=UPI00370B4CB4
MRIKTMTSCRVATSYQVGASTSNRTSVRQHRDRLSRRGMSLLEVIAAVIVASMIAITGLMFVRTQGQTSAERTCMGHSCRLQQDAELYQRETGKSPDSKLEAIRNGDYSGNRLPQCPMHGNNSTQTNYRWDGSNVVCKYHPGS